MSEGDRLAAQARRAFVGLGSNLDGPVQRLQQALGALGQLPETVLLAQSGLYRSPPWGFAEQPEFINAVAELTTRLSPEALLAQLIELERAAGRRRDGPRYGPRVLDLDLLWMQDVVRTGDSLALPHPRMAERVFVLVPLAELDPELRLADGRSVSETLAGLDCRDLQRLQVMETD